MMTTALTRIATALTLLALAPQGVAQDWTSWRGPNQNGTSSEDNLPGKVEIQLGSPAKAGGSWTYEIKGRGTPVIDGTRLYGLGYEGEGKELQEVLFCLDATTGKKIWEQRFNDFITDVIYGRFSIGSPTVDPETHMVYHLSTAGLLSCFSPEGKLTWQKSLLAEYGRSTYPNGRTGAPLIDGKRLIVHSPTSSWGKHAPTRDRCYAFDKKTGESLWSCTPGGRPKDGSFSFPVLSDEDGRRYLYLGLAGGHLAKIDARTGDPIWKFQMSIGGMSSSPLLYKNSIIASHGKENIDNSTIGRMISLTLDGQADSKKPADSQGPAENWRNTAIVAFTSSPVLVGNRVYQTVANGELHCIDADTGKTLWHEKLGSEQIHASPAWGDGKLYVPMNNGSFYILEPNDAGPDIKQKVELEGNCLGAPAIAHGKIYVHTTERLYCFSNGPAAKSSEPKADGISGATVTTGDATRIQVIPADILLQQGDVVPFRARSLDAKGNTVKDPLTGVKWSGIEGTGIEDGLGAMRVAKDATPGAFTLKAEAGGLSGTARVRIVRRIPWSEDFSGPSPLKYWLRTGKKWEILERDGNMVLAKPLSMPLFQRSMSQIGHPSASKYTVAVDILTDGNRRIKSSAGVVNQRYLIVLKGNHQQIEISSNMELLKENVKFRWKAKTWYRLKTRVDIQADGSGIIRAKCWKRDDAEPDAWNLEVHHPNAHTHGAPGIYGFVPQSRFRVYLDNLTVTPNK